MLLVEACKCACPAGNMHAAGLLTHGSALDDVKWAACRHLPTVGRHRRRQGMKANAKRSSRLPCQHTANAPRKRQHAAPTFDAALAVAQPTRLAQTDPAH